MYTPDDYQGPSEFVHFHDHTLFSVLDGVATPSQYAKTCKARGYPAMAITEHGHLASVPDNYIAFREAGVKYIAGVEIYYNDWEPTRAELAKQKDFSIRKLRFEDPQLYTRMVSNRHLTLIAKNKTGFHNLLKLTTDAWKHAYGAGRTKFPRCTFEDICKFKEGVIVLSGCLNGPVAHELWRGSKGAEIRGPKPKLNANGEPDDPSQFELVDGRWRGKVLWAYDGSRESQRERIMNAIKYVKKFKAAFGDDYYIELQMPRIPNINDEYVFRRLAQFAAEYKIKAVLANDSHYLKREDYELQKIMMAVAQGRTVDDPDLFHVNSDEQFMKTRAELWSTYRTDSYSDGLGDSFFHTICDNTLEVADKCEFLDIDTSAKLPEFDDADNKLSDTVHRRLRDIGFDKCTDRFLIDGREVTYAEQANIELRRFIDKGFASYFLITNELIQYGKSQGWPFSPRGSAGGSLVCFLLGIHNVNPMLWNLSFDRFLSPARGGFMLNTKMPNPVN